MKWSIWPTARIHHGSDIVITYLPLFSLPGRLIPPFSPPWPLNLLALHRHPSTYHPYHHRPLPPIYQEWQDPWTKEMKERSQENLAVKPIWHSRQSNVKTECIDTDFKLGIFTQVHLCWFILRIFVITVDMVHSKYMRKIETDTNFYLLIFEVIKIIRQRLLIRHSVLFPKTQFAIRSNHTVLSKTYSKKAKCKVIFETT